MSSEKTKWWKTPPYSNIVGGLAVAFIIWIAKLAYDWYTVTPILSTVGELFTYIWDNLISFLKAPIPLWAVLGTFFWYSIIYWLYHKKGKTNKVEKPILKEIQHTGQKAYAPVALDIEDDSTDYISHENYDKLHRKMDKDEAKRQRMLNYKADKFLNFTWEWEWILNKKIQIYEVKNITPCCPTPKCNLSPLTTINNRMATYTVYYCATCRTYPTVNKATFKRMEDEIEEYVMGKVEKF